MNKELVIKSYLKGLEEANYNNIISLFTEEAIVNSPLYGQIKAALFYKELLTDTSTSKIELHDIFKSENNSDVFAAYFTYSWVLANGMTDSFKCVDIFNFLSGTNKIQYLTIIYDTYKIRSSFNQLHNK